MKRLIPAVATLAVAEPLLLLGTVGPGCPLPLPSPAPARTATAAVAPVVKPPPPARPAPPPVVKPEPPRRPRPVPRPAPVHAGMMIAPAAGRRQGLPLVILVVVVLVPCVAAAVVRFAKAR
ncbi:MAG TPA: hypothetical protein VG164_00635 [Trebonia sp.]|nr:hypothetical protein [Trebonia sp.]